MKTLISHVCRSLPALFIVLFSLLAATAQITDSRMTDPKIPSANPAGPDEVRISSGKRVRFNPQLTEEQSKEIQDARNRVITSPTACPGAFPAPIAFSVLGFGDFSGGQDSILYYNKLSDKVITNEGGGWINPSTFIAPCAGLYVFAISFVKDAYYNGGTADDVTMYLIRNGNPGDPISFGCAWSGQGSLRTTGAYSVTYRLAQGDSIQSWVHSDGHPLRYLGIYAFSGYRVAP